MGSGSKEGGRGFVAIGLSVGDGFVFWDFHLITQMIMME
jgi:hypothetical protein